MNGINLLEAKHFTRIVLEHYLRENDYYVFSETDYYKNDNERYEVVYKLQSVVVSKITVIYKKSNYQLRENKDSDTIYGIILND